MEEKIISMYAKGMTTADIESHMRELYDLEISDSTVSRITDKILPIVKEWQERPLESVYAVVFMDAIHFHARNEGRIVKRAVYIAIGIDMEGRKDVLGMYVGQNESAKFWLSILNGLKNRGVEDILIACVDGLTVFPQAIVFANDDMAFFGYRVYEKRGHKVGKDLYEAKNTTRALSVELKMVARSATISVFKV